MSTSAQMAFVQEDGFTPDFCKPGEQRSSTEFFPYFDERYIAVAASLTGQSFNQYLLISIVHSTSSTQLINMNRW